MNEQTAKSIIDEWLPFDEAYRAFVDSNPMLGLGRGEWASMNVRRNFGGRLIEAGAVRQIVNRRWLAHREKFGPALFELLAREPGRIVAEAQRRA